MKLLGVIFWCCALFGFVMSLTQLSTENVEMMFVISMALFIYLSALLYGWLWSNQKGHRALFLSIFLAVYLATIVWFRNEMVLGLYGLAIIWFFIGMYVLVIKYRASFVTDFKNGVKRDHFMNTSNGNGVN